MTPKIKGDTAWMIVSTAFVLLMVPGLALFYGGMVRRKNILGHDDAEHGRPRRRRRLLDRHRLCPGVRRSVDQDAGAMRAACSASVQDLVFLNGIKPTTMLPGNNIPVYLHMLYQGMFAIITPALISGAVAERIRFKPYCIFLILWVTFVYCPLAHCVWAMDGDGPTTCPPRHLA